MEHIHKIALIFALVVLPAMGFCQAETSEEAILHDIRQQNDELLENLAGARNNETMITQVGDQNNVMLKQANTNPGNPNLSLILQNGNGNTAEADISGRYIGVDLTQNGNSNSYVGNLSGYLLISTMIQEGNNNLIEQYLKGSDMKYHIQQQGEGHELIQVEQGSGIGYSVTQKGTDMKIRIEQEQVLRR